jgi:hypothetical protein
MNQPRLQRTFMILILAGLLLTVATGVGQEIVVRSGPVTQRPSSSLPATQLFRADAALLMADTRTGAVFSLEGSPTNQSVRNRWRLRVPAVDQTSGTLELVQTRSQGEPAVLLVDRVGGRTWILKYRSNFTGIWEEIPRDVE